MNVQLIAIGVGSIVLLAVIGKYFEDSIRGGIWGLRLKLQTEGVATTKRDKIINVLLKKEFWLFVALYGGATYVFIQREGADSIMLRAAIAGMLLTILAAPIAYMLAKMYVSVSKDTVAAFDATEENHDLYVTCPETISKLKNETDERIGRRETRFGNIVHAIQDVLDAQALEIRGLGPRETPDDDAIIADPKRQLEAWRDTIMDTFAQVRDELVARPAQQAQAEYETANQFALDYEQSSSRYGEKQEEAKREMSNYEGRESDKDKPESEENEESLGELARQMVDNSMDESSKGGDNE